MMRLTLSAMYLQIIFSGCSKKRIIYLTMTFFELMILEPSELYYKTLKK